MEYARLIDIYSCWFNCTNDIIAGKFPLEFLQVALWELLKTSVHKKYACLRLITLLQNKKLNTSNMSNGVFGVDFVGIRGCCTTNYRPCTNCRGRQFVENLAKTLHHKLSSVLHKLSWTTICGKFSKNLTPQIVVSPAQVVVDDNLCCSYRSQFLISQTTICAGEMKPNCANCRRLHILTSVSRYRSYRRN